jgi:hypothetical protein
MHRHAGRLVDGQQDVVLVEDFDRAAAWVAVRRLAAPFAEAAGARVSALYAVIGPTRRLLMRTSPLRRMR